jgi:hypothetical protein
MPHSATGQEAAGIECKRTTGCRWVESWRILGNQDRLPLRDVETSSPLPPSIHTHTHPHTQHTPDTRKSILNVSTSRALPVGPPPPPGRCLVHSQSRNCQPIARGGMGLQHRQAIRSDRKRRIEKSRGVGQTTLFLTGTSEGEEVARLLSCCWPISPALVGPYQTTPPSARTKN